MNLDSDEDEFQSVLVFSRRYNILVFSEEFFMYFVFLKEKLFVEFVYNGVVGKIKVYIFNF